MPEVKLHLYDLSRGLASIGTQGAEGVWHTGVVLGDTEYFYGHGIHSAASGRTAAGTPDRVLELGASDIPQDINDAYLVALSEGRYAGSRYNIFDNNSNTFADDYARFLTGQGIPAYVRDLPQLLANNGQTLLSFLANFENNMAAQDAEPVATRAPQQGSARGPEGPSEGPRGMRGSGCGFKGQGRGFRGCHGGPRGAWGPRGGPFGGCGPAYASGGCGPCGPGMFGPMLIPILKRRAAAGGCGFSMSPEHFEEALNLCMAGGCGPRRGPRGPRGPCGDLRRVPVDNEGPAEGLKGSAKGPGAPVDPGMVASGSKDVPMEEATAEERAEHGEDALPALEDMLRGVLRGVASAVNDALNDALNAGEDALGDVMAEHQVAEASLATAAAAAEATNTGGVAEALTGLKLNEEAAKEAAEAAEQAGPEQAGSEEAADGPGLNGDDFEMLEKGTK